MLYARQMTFEEYFQWEGQSEIEQLLRFLLGLSPKGLQMSYLADDTRLDIANHKGPSTPMACDFCAGMVGTYALKILLNRGEIIAAPSSYILMLIRINSLKPGVLAEITTLYND